MKHINTKGIVLSRTNFGEADRIITFLTPEQGKVRTLARGVRKQKSKLAGGIELFSVSDISYLIGRGDIFTITSTRLISHYGQIVKDIDRTNLGYEFIKAINKNTEDNPEPAYFDLLQAAFVALEDKAVGLDLIKLWFYAQLLKLAGHSPNLRSDETGQKLAEGKKYIFDFDKMTFRLDGQGYTSFNANHIKFLRLIFGNNSPKALQKIQAADKLTDDLLPLISAMIQNFIRL